MADKTGKVTHWAVEFGGPNALMRRGLRKTDFPIGAEVYVNGYLAKSGKPVANGSTVKLPDGRDFFAGSENTGAFWRCLDFRLLFIKVSRCNQANWSLKWANGELTISQLF